MFTLAWGAPIVSRAGLQKSDIYGEAGWLPGWRMRARRTETELQFLRKPGLPGCVASGRSA